DALARFVPFGVTGPGQQPIGLYFHFGRRSAAFGGDATCQYFTDTQGPCQVAPDGSLSPEVDELAAWAVQNARVPRFGPLMISTDGTNYQPLAGKTLPALAVFLHALADSYSHPKCYETSHFQGHRQQPSECNAQTWHGQEEFGAGQPGLPYTRSAAEAVWQQLKAFRKGWTGQGSKPLWSDAETTAYITAW